MVSHKVYAKNKLLKVNEILKVACEKYEALNIAAISISFDGNLGNKIMTEYISPIIRNNSELMGKINLLKSEIKTVSEVFIFLK